MLKEVISPVYAIWDIVIHDIAHIQEHWRVVLCELQIYRLHGIKPESLKIHKLKHKRKETRKTESQTHSQLYSNHEERNMELVNKRNIVINGKVKTFQPMSIWREEHGVIKYSLCDKIKSRKQSNRKKIKIKIKI